MNGVPKISLRGVRKTFGEIVAVESLDLDIMQHEIVCLLGPSGCGKSTCLEIMAGFEDVTSGRVEIDGRSIEGTGPDRIVIFQQPALFPWMTVRENVTIGPRARHLRGYRERAEELLATVQLERFGDHYPYQLSGGMMQRVAIARGLVGNPNVLLMDEPFGALDAQTRLSMQELLLSIRERYQPTIVFITHDVDEAIFLGDRVVVMTPRPGRIRESFVVPFGRNRTFELLTTPEFNQIKQHVLTLLHLREPS